MTEVCVRHCRFRFSWLLLLLLAVLSCCLAADATPGPQIHASSSDLQDHDYVVKSANGKPLENAAVIFHPLKDGKMTAIWK